MDYCQRNPVVAAIAPLMNSLHRPLALGMLYEHGQCLLSFPIGAQGPSPVCLHAERPLPPLGVPKLPCRLLTNGRARIALMPPPSKVCLKSEVFTKYMMACVSSSRKPQYQWP